MTEISAKKGPGHALRLAAGWALTVAGLILGPVPIVPGFVLLLPGLALLCAESRWLRALLRRHRERLLLRRAMREMERVGLKIDLEAEPEESSAPRDPGTDNRG